MPNNHGAFGLGIEMAGGTNAVQWFRELQRDDDDISVAVDQNRLKPREVQAAAQNSQSKEEFQRALHNLIARPK